MIATALMAVRNHVRAHVMIFGAVGTVLTVLSGTAQAGPFVFWNQRTPTMPDFIVNNSQNWQTILTIVVPAGFLAGHGHACQATASLDAKNPGGNLVRQYYFFTVTQNNANPPISDTGIERTIELRNQPGVDDLDFLPVSTNAVFGFTANTPQVIRLLGRKFPGAPNLAVDDAVLSIICV
jgi:hypothetical protein